MKDMAEKLAIAAPQPEAEPQPSLSFDIGGMKRKKKDGKVVDTEPEFALDPAPEPEQEMDLRSVILGSEEVTETKLGVTGCEDCFLVGLFSCVKLFLVTI